MSSSLEMYEVPVFDEFEQKEYFVLVGKSDLLKMHSGNMILMLELMVLNINLDRIEMTDFSWIHAETCISINILNYGTIEICEDDFRDKNKAARLLNCESLRSGASTIFYLLPHQEEELQIKGFDLNVTVTKNFVPPKIIARALIPMKQLLKAVMIKKTTESLSRSMKERFQLYNENQDVVGYADFYLRLTSFGKTIVTQFQIDPSNDCMEFSSKSNIPYKYETPAFPNADACKMCQKYNRNTNHLTFKMVNDDIGDFTIAKLSASAISRLRQK